MLVVLLVDSAHVGGDVITLSWGCDQHLLGASLCTAVTYVHKKVEHDLQDTAGYVDNPKHGELAMETVCENSAVLTKYAEYGHWWSLLQQGD